MPLYSELIRIEDEYNYSANIQFDIENDKKLLRFIPNDTTIDLLREYFIDITRINPLHHARMLYGSYGTGKSHFLTVLSLLLEKRHVEGNGYNTFLSRIAKYDDKLASDINSYVNDKQKKPFLVVPIVFDFDDFERCIYFSLKKKLESIGKKVSFKTFFDQATALIEQWKNSEESKERLLKACKSSKITLEEMEEMLSIFDKKSEKKFQSIFSKMTFGVKYIYEVTNLSQTLNEASEAISDKYSGIVFIFDEFGRYIEDNIKTIKVKAVQDLAEFCDHGSGNNHIILVSHKEISQYTQRFGKSISHEWKKVEGRYKQTPINDSQDQCLSLIRSVLEKNVSPWKKFKTKFKKELNDLYSEAADFRGFMIDSENAQNQFEGGFPLHPISLFALDKLSKKVAQNERTFFTYLASKEDNSLYSFLKKYKTKEFHFVGIDEIYDYFEPSIKSTQSDASFEWYKELQIALSKNHSSSNDDTPETRILKVIATIGIINDPSALTANKTTIVNVIDLPKDIITNALERLCERKIIKYSGAYDRYNFFEASIFDVEEIINDECQAVSLESTVNTLNDEFVDFVLYPYDYNRVYKISRIFIPSFATLQDLQRKAFSNKFGKYYDGILIMLLSNPDDDIDEIINISKDIKRSIIFVNNETSSLTEYVKRYIAIKYLDSKKSEYIAKDPAFEKELDYYKDEYRLNIIELINQWKRTFEETNTVVIEGETLLDIKSIKDLSDAASKIMYNSFPNTLIVNNELINKNTISGSIMSAKKNVIANILSGEAASNYYSVPYLSPDYIAVRSVLVKNGFISTEEQTTLNSVPGGINTHVLVKNKINNFIKKARNEQVGFEQVINDLKEPPFGLRNGYLSLLLAHFLIPYKKSLIINSHGVEKELTVDLFEEIVRRPSDFTFTIANWTDDQLDFLSSLENIFHDYIAESALSKNRLKAIYDGMLLHYKNVPKFARTTQVYISEKAKQYRNIISKSTANYSSFIFSSIKSLGSSYDNAIDQIVKIKSELEDSVNALSREIVSSIFDIFEVPNNMSAGKMLCSNYEKQWKSKRTKSFDYYTNAFLELVSNITADQDDYSIVMQLTKTLTGFEIIYWNDSHKDNFVDRLKEIKTKLSLYHGEGSLGDSETKVTISTASGNEKSLVFDRSELSALSSTLKNKIHTTFKNYGLSVSYDEKVQVLLSLLEDLMEGKE